MSELGSVCALNTNKGWIYWKGRIILSGNSFFNMPQIEITRSSEYANRLRDIKIFIDNQHVGSLANGKTAAFEVPEGNHIIQAKIDWGRSNIINVELEEGEKKAFQLTSFAKHNPLGTLAAIYYTTIASDRYLHLEAC